MTAVLLPWLEFALCGALIGMAGPVLTHYGDIIARLTGLSRSWIGLVLLATATSLPELFTGISAVTVAGAPNIAVGDALGSCVFNLVMLVLLDELSRGEPMYRRIDQGHVLTAGFGVILIGAAGAFLLLSQDALNFQLPAHQRLHALHHRALSGRDARGLRLRAPHARAPPQMIKTERDITLRAGADPLWPAAAVVVAAGAWLPFIGRDIAERDGLEDQLRRHPADRRRHLAAGTGGDDQRAAARRRRHGDRQSAWAAICSTF